MKLQPAHAEARYYLGLVLLAQGRGGSRDREPAARRQGGAEHGGRAPSRWEWRFSTRGRPEAAVASLRRAVAIDPSLEGARNSLGLALLQQGNADEAIATFRALLAARPDDLLARHNLGSALLQTADLDGAMQVYRELSERAPGNAEAFYNLGMALKQKDDFAGAETALRRAMALDPRLPEAPYTLAVVLWQTQRPDGGRSPSCAPRSSCGPTTPTRTSPSAPSCGSRARWTRRWPRSARPSAAGPDWPRPT